MKLFKFTKKSIHKLNQTNKNKNQIKKETNRQQMAKHGFYGPPTNVTSRKYQETLSLDDILKFLNPNSVALYQTAKVDFKTTIKAKAAIAGIDAAALAVKFLIAIDITQFRKALDFFKNKKT